MSRRNEGEVPNVNGDGRDPPNDRDDYRERGRGDYRERDRSSSSISIRDFNSDKDDFFLNRRSFIQIKTLG